MRVTNHVHEWMSNSVVSDSRGQTTLDFTIAMVLFIGVIGGVFLLLPTVFDPLTTSTTAKTIVADQIATQVSTDLLTSTDSSSVTAVCTAAFFGTDTTLDDECAFTADDSLDNLVGINDRTNTHIYMQRTGLRESNTPASITVHGTEYTLERPEPTRKENTAIAKRIVAVQGETYVLTVEVW